MGIPDSLFGQGFFRPRPDDVNMRQSAGSHAICQPCDCLQPQHGNGRFGRLHLHSETQSTDCDAWRLLERLVETAAAKWSKEFAPGLDMPPDMWSQIITLPRSIAKLTSVRRLYLHGSNLVRIPPEIGTMENLEEWDIYTSYRLHWLPYEVTRCQKLKRSRASTRALYGNYKYRPPFPPLGDEAAKRNFVTGNCGVCGRVFSGESVFQVWISLRVATDVFPLLVNACSEGCIRGLPRPANGYVGQPHTGGRGLQQPPPGHGVRGVVIPNRD